jgi:hypothetical protein
MKLTLVVRADLSLDPDKFAAQAAHAPLVSELANLGTPDFRAWLRDGSPWPRRAAMARKGLDGNRMAPAWPYWSR